MQFWACRYGWGDEECCPGEKSSLSCPVSSMRSFRFWPWPPCSYVPCVPVCPVSSSVWPSHTVRGWLPMYVCLGPGEN